jgi:hypothetical protein
MDKFGGIYVTIFIISLFITFSVGLGILQKKEHKIKIQRHIKEMKGEVVKISKKSYCPGPFLVIRRGRTVYEIQYKSEDELRKAWVKFGDIWGPEWIL